MGTPLFGQCSFLEETLSSVLLQGYPNRELIMIDGGSTDQSIDLLRKYSPWLRYWASELGAGQANALNKGFVGYQYVMKMVTGVSHITLWWLRGIIKSDEQFRNP